jgi:hypothetical protein
MTNPVEGHCHLKWKMVVGQAEEGGVLRPLRVTLRLWLWLLLGIHVRCDRAT